jgi:hypothetical protein
MTRFLERLWKAIRSRRLEGLAEDLLPVLWPLVESRYIEPLDAEVTALLHRGEVRVDELLEGDFDVKAYRRLVRELRDGTDTYLREVMD